MKNTLKTLLVVGSAGLALAACGPGDKGVASSGTTTTAPTTTSASAKPITPPPVTITETRTETVIVPAPDGRLGYGKLKLGMTEQEAMATGMVGSKTGDDGNCRVYRLAENPDVANGVLISHKSGLVKIALPSAIKTSKGIGAGATVADVKEAYPNAKSYRSGLTAGIEGNAIVDFKVDFKTVEPADSDKVLRIGLTNNDAGECSFAFL